MTRRRLISIVLLATACTTILGCPFVNNAPILPGLSLGSIGLTVGDVVTGRTIPPVESASIRVEIDNQSGFAAATRLTMRVGGRQVHLSTRRIEPRTAFVVIGPDRADSILFEATVLSASPFSLPPEARFLGEDFTSGDTVRFVIQLPIQSDCNENAIDDTGEPDHDGDGLIDDCDLCPDDPAKQEPRECGCGTAETDSDGDGIPNCIDPCPDSASDADTDQDGIPDCNDPCPDSASNGDTDGDGTLDCFDACPEDPHKTQPGACGCGVAEVDVDEDGLADCIDQCIGLPGNGNANSNGNIDTDGDGISDCLDGCPDDPAKTHPGTCGCNVADTDRDEDETPDCLDGCPDDPHKIVPGACGCGVADTDSDEDGTPDCLEPPALMVQISGLEQDIRVNEGALILFDISIENFSPAALVRAFARPVPPVPGFEIQIEIDSAPMALIHGSWMVEEATPGTYEVCVEVRDGPQTAGDCALGHVIVNAEPLLKFDSPYPDQLVSRALGFTIAWAGQDDDDDAQISIFLDVDNEENGNEILLREGISEDDVNDREFQVDPISLDLPDGVYFVGGVITDPLTRFGEYGNQVCIVDRLVGRVQAADLVEGVTIITGDAGNHSFGHSLDASKDVTLDGKDDILVGDPDAVVDPGNGPITPGEAYLFSHEPNWSRLLDTGDARTRFVNDQDQSRLGERVASLWQFARGDSLGRVLLGAPLFDVKSGGASGRAFWATVLAGSQYQRYELCCTPFPMTSYLDGDFDNHAGADLAQLTDVSGDGLPDIAIGAQDAGGDGFPGPGLVGIVSGDYGDPPLGALSSHAFLIRGTNASGDLGHSVRGMLDINFDEKDEIVIGDPLGAYPGRLRTGVVHVVLGTGVLNQIGEASVYPDSRGGYTLNVLHLVGESLDDLAGFAVASGDFNGNERPDLLIGAPMHEGGRGRAYLLYDLELPKGPFVIDLAQVGQAVPGAVFDGVHAGERLGWAVAFIGDLDLDGHQDIALGSPGGESERGLTRLIYGGQKLTGNVPLALFTCSVAGAELVANENILGQFGAALSAGDVNGDAGSDLVVGAPAIGTHPGEVYVIYGRPD